MPETISEAVPAECVEVTRQVWDHLDDHLWGDELDTVRLHLDECAHCRAFARFQNGYLDAMREVSLGATRAPWHVRARVLDSLVNEGFCP